MRMDDMILVSIDDHMIEPPGHVQEPRPGQVARPGPQGRPQRRRASTSGCSRARRPRPRSAWRRRSAGPERSGASTPGAFSELRPGCFDVHERVRDMNANGVLASMCFPTMAGFNARTFTEAGDKELSLVMLQAYNDWHIDEWCGAYPGRFIPLGIVPMWDVDLAVEEIQRIAKKGCRAISFLEAPHAAGLPSFLSGHWDPMLEALVDENMVLCLHIGGAVGHHQAGRRSARRPHDRDPVAGHHAHRAGPAVRSDAAPVPRPQGRAVRGRHRLDPLLPRPGRPPLPEPGVDRQQLRRGQAAVRRLPRALPRLLHHRPVGAEAAATRSASTSSPGSATTRTPTRPGPTRRSSRGRSSRTPAAPTRRSTRSPGRTRRRFFGWDPFAHTPKEQASVGALRALATDVDTARMPREEWRKRNEAAGIGAL